MTKAFVPSGRLSTKKRDFKDVVSDVRHATFSVHRHRPLPNGQYAVTALGSGFFVSPEVFITCRHVIDSPQSAHQAGDVYRLVNNLDGVHGILHEVNGGIGVDIHLYPDHDFAIMLSKTKIDQPYLSISYADIPVGADIGIAGYPIAELIPDANGLMTLGGMVFRVARGVATAYYQTTVNSADGHPLTDVPVLEVNFIFVPGNSGGPIFDASTGRVVAYVKGFRAHKIRENAEQCQLMAVPTGLPPNYIGAVYAVYSIGLTLSPVRAHLEHFGVKL
jgi:hypothetical protein